MTHVPSNLTSGKDSADLREFIADSLACADTYLQMALRTNEIGDTKGTRYALSCMTAYIKAAFEAQRDISMGLSRTEGGQ